MLIPPEEDKTTQCEVEHVIMVVRIQIRIVVSYNFTILPWQIQDVS
jgi:hypothetical protein